MNWKLKATLQQFISLLPNIISNQLYYQAQRKFGGYRSIKPLKRFNSGKKFCSKIKELRGNPENKSFLEVGTGRVPLIPISLYLMGAKEVITIDKDKYLKLELIKETLKYITENKEEVINLFGGDLKDERMEQIISIAKKDFSLNEFLEFLNFTYFAPGDASKVDLPENSIDYHISYNVFEHIPHEIIKGIVKEGNRVVKPEGIFMHKIDYTDHFVQMDKSISSINFLQYSERQWNFYAGNRYMFMNRLRHDDYISIFKEYGHTVLDSKIEIDPNIKRLLNSNKFKLSPEFKEKSGDILQITSAWLCTKNENKI